MEDVTDFESAKKPVPVALAIGILGGAALIMTTELTNTGPAIYIPYAVLIIAIFTTLRSIHWPKLSKRFTTSFLAFMVSTVILYLFITTVSAGTLFEITIWGHAWRLGFMAVIGGILSLAVAYLADIGRSQIA